MKKLIIVIVILTGFLNATYSFAQSKISDRLSISLSGGLSVPIGSYSGSNALESASYGPEDIYSFLIGFSKEKNGFAKIGSYYLAEVKYRTAKQWLFLLRVGQFTNEVEADNISAFLTDDIFYFQTNVAHVDYTIFHITPGVGYAFSKNLFEFDVILFSGYARCNYPNYATTIENNRLRHWNHRGEMPDLESLAIGASFSALYHLSPKFTLGIECSYLHSGFEYSMQNELYPGGTEGYEFDDKLKVRVLNTGIKIAYKF